MTSGSSILATDSDGADRRARTAPITFGAADLRPKRRVWRSGAAAALLVIALSSPAKAETTPLEDLLLRTGRVVETFWGQISGVTCREAISQSKLDLKGKTIYQQEGVFDYLVLLRMEGQDLSVEESRVSQREPHSKKKVTLLVTSGFSTLVLIFHPYYQSSFEFSQQSEEMLDGKHLLRVRFQPIPGARSPSALMAGGREFALALEGTAWIEPDSGAIVRITARLETPLEDIGLRRMESDVRYAPVSFEGGAAVYWLPVSASIEAETTQQRWRNVHRFSGYRKFTVNSRIVPSH